MSYLDITTNGIFVDYIEYRNNWFIEVWEMGVDTYYLQWFANANTNLPNTITKNRII